MSTFRKQSCKCAICDNESEVTVLTSTNSFGSPDLDLRPAEMKRSTMWLWVQKCPYCGYVHSMISSPLSVTKEFLSSEEYLSCEGIQFKRELADIFYKHYMVLMHCGRSYDAYSALLHAAWACDDANDKENASLLRSKMVDLFDTLPVSWKKNINWLAQLADVMRRCGKFDELIERFADFNSNDDIVNQVVAFQIELAQNKDTGVYRVSDAVKK